MWTNRGARAHTNTRVGAGCLQPAAFFSSPLTPYGVGCREWCRYGAQGVVSAGWAVDPHRGLVVANIDGNVHPTQLYS